MAHKTVKITCVFLAVLCFACFLSALAYGAAGCTLNDPDRDVKRIFPESTGYKTTFITIQEKGGKDLMKKIGERLGDKLDPVYESPEVPYAYYTILKGTGVIGWIHGVNQKGLYGGMQLILATDPDGKIIDFYYQKLSSPEAGKFTDPAFTEEFKGLTLADFYENKGRLSKIEPPAEKSHEDFIATLRGIKKNLILLDEFILSKEKNDEDKK